ncbi:MAG TPA: hypothetical protein VLC06_03415 [Polyangia bacterium]|nr:hypothetical protein [Polyangia bacterium]
MIEGRGGWGGDRGGRGRRVALTLLLVSAVACGGGGNATVGGTGGGSGTTGGIGSSSGTDSDAGASSSPWTALSPAQVSVQGGTALSAAGQGQNGGVVHLVSQGDSSFDPTQAPAQATIPTAPAGATPVAASALGADLSITGDAVVNADVTTSGSDATRKISVSGDLYVTSKLQAGDLGSARQGIDLEVGGSIYVGGAVDTSGASGSGEAGGALRLVAKQVIVTGTLSSAGGDGIQGGGAAGALTVQSTGNVLLAGTILIRGGAASGAGGGGAQGGAAAALTIDANGSVALGGTVDGRGGVASAAASGGTIAGGAGGSIHIGETAPPTAIVVFVPVVVSGGAGGASAGTGGTITPEPDTGNVNVAGAMELDLRGGDSMTAPGAGGLLNGGARKDPGSGGVHISGEIVASGGSIITGGSGNGADGGRVDMELTPTDGAVAIDQSAKITVEGGNAGGAGTAGGGGHVWFWTKDGDETIAGSVSVRGGDAPDAGGIGGGGGMIYFFSDNNHNGVQVCKGNLDVTPTGVLDASGGSGSMGGSGRSDGKVGSVADFPANQEEIAVFLNCDGEHGNTCNWMKNEGQVIARGGVHNGNGGDVVYHGIPPGVLGTPSPFSGDYPVPPGMVDTSGDGTGVKGDFDGQ